MNESGSGKYKKQTKLLEIVQSLREFLTNQNSGFSSDQSGCIVQTSSSNQSRSMVQFTTSKNASYFNIKGGLLTPFHPHPLRQILTGTTISLIPHPQISTFPLYLFYLLSHI
jgi:hypothetical protein